MLADILSNGEMSFLLLFSLSRLYGLFLRTTFKKVLTFNLDNDSIFTINYRRTNEWASFHLQLNTSISTLSTFLVR